jgi:hypothetical protein
MNDTDEPKRAQSGLTLYTLGAIATVAVAYHDPNHMLIKLDDHGHPESPRAPTNQVKFVAVAANVTSMPVVSRTLLFSPGGNWSRN